MRRTTAAAALASALMALVLTGCGIDDGGNGSQAPVASNAPACDSTWLPGGTLPDSYDGCLEDDQEDNALVAAVVSSCGDGASLTTYDDRYWARLGGEVHDTGVESGLDDDADYAAELAACTG